MDKEREIIRIIHEALGCEDVQNIFTTDAQIFDLNGRSLLFTVDEYSEEDFFRDHHAFTLASNLVTATLSDILAAGGKPTFYGHSMTVPVHWNRKYLKNFCKGIKHCLKEAQTTFVGGDTGFGDTWKYTGIAFGTLLASLTRCGAGAGDLIYMTGNVGAGNLEAALKIHGSKPVLKTLLHGYRIKFPHRSKEAETTRKYATSCTDSSDGILKALINLATSNSLGFEASNLPYLTEGVLACKLLSTDKTLLFMGECGEYELVFTIPASHETSFLKDVKVKGILVTRIGHLTDTKKYLLMEDGRMTDFSGYDIHARNFSNTREYISALSDFLVYHPKQNMPDE